MLTKIFILLISFVFTLHAQIDSALSYYPLKTGNVWQYWYHYKIAFTDRRESTYVTLKVVGDTLMPNGKWYKIINGPHLIYMQTNYQRWDSTTASVYCYTDYPLPSEILTDSLRAQVRDVFGWQVRCVGIDTISIFGIKTVTKTFEPSTPFTPIVRFAQGFGIVTSWHLEDNPVWPLYDTYTYDLVYAKIDEHEYGTLTSVTSLTENLPSHFTLAQNYPNPFNPSTTIRFSIPTNSYVSLKIFNVLGQEVATVGEGNYSNGEYLVHWNASSIGSGVYFYRLQANNFSETKKLLLQK